MSQRKKNNAGESDSVRKKSIDYISERYFYLRVKGDEKKISKRHGDYAEKNQTYLHLIIGSKRNSSVVSVGSRGMNKKMTAKLFFGSNYHLYR